MQRDPPLSAVEMLRARGLALYRLPPRAIRPAKRRAEMTPRHARSYSGPAGHAPRVVTPLRGEAGLRPLRHGSFRVGCGRAARASVRAVGGCRVPQASTEGAVVTGDRRVVLARAGRPRFVHGYGRAAASRPLCLWRRDRSGPHSRVCGRLAVGGSSSMPSRNLSPVRNARSFMGAAVEDSISESGIPDGVVPQLDGKSGRGSTCAGRSRCCTESHEAVARRGR